MHTAIPHWPRPLALLAALVQERTGGGRPSWVATVADAMTDEDWQDFVPLAISRHRIAQLLMPGLDGLDMPDACRSTIGKHLKQNAQRTLVQIAETRKVHQTLQDRGIPMAVLKSWPMAERLFGSASGRHTGDLDLLIPPDRMLEVCDVLGTMGYRPSVTNAKFRRRARALSNPRLRSACKDVELYNPGTGVSIELHWQPLNYRGWRLGMDNPGQLADQPSQAGTLLVPEPRTELVYLAIHGSLHLWDRLKWLADIAAVAQNRGCEVLAKDLAWARSQDLHRPLILALSLSARLFGSPAPDGAQAGTFPVLENWIVRRLADRGRPGVYGMRYQIGMRFMGLALSATWPQRWGVIEYDTVRRLKLLSLDV